MDEGPGAGDHGPLPSQWEDWEEAVLRLEAVAERCYGSDAGEAVAAVLDAAESGTSPDFDAAVEWAQQLLAAGDASTASEAAAVRSALFVEALEVLGADGTVPSGRSSEQVASELDALEDLVPLVEALHAVADEAVVLWARDGMDLSDAAEVAERLG